MLRLEAGRDPLNSGLTALIGELSTLSPQLRQDWAEQDVHEHRTGRKVYRHPQVGAIDILRRPRAARRARPLHRHVQRRGRHRIRRQARLARFLGSHPGVREPASPPTPRNRSGLTLTLREAGG
ncbi:hypothetical protein ACLQ22_22435 [Micromonospora sp. DT178]|uniref:MmyB family transcriptional regulator n=1 Tax=Micromonospora sp. DT178 TaxID=3393436 RepID=UPI003CF3D950